jgi:DNA repair protein RecO (recombination protein O)
MTSARCAVSATEMNDRRVQLQPAFILHRKPYRETSLLVEAFTRDFGRVGLVARGVRRGKSRMAALVQPFQPLLLSFSGNGELQTLTAAEQSGRPTLLKGRPVISGFYLNELLLRLLQRADPHPGLFADYASALQCLGESEDRTLRAFELALLEALGYGLSLDVDTHGQPIEPEGLYHYRLEEGPVRCTSAPAGALLIHGRSLMALSTGELHTPEALGEAKRLLRAALSIYLGNRPLASRSLYRQALAGPGESSKHKEQ